MLSVVDMCRHHRDVKLEFELDIDKWNTMDPDVLNIVSTGWESIKYLKSDGTSLSDEISELPNDSGGIYIFVLQPDKIPSLHRYIMYIGRARRRNNTFSLRTRCREYIKDTRPQIAYMVATWGKDLYLYYLPLDGDDVIEKVERELIRVVIPPCNDKIPDYDLLPESPAFQTPAF